MSEFSGSTMKEVFVQAFAIYDTESDAYLNTMGSKGPLDWYAVPKLYATLDGAKGAFRSVRGTRAYWKPDMTNAIVVEIQFVRGDKNLL